MNEGFFAALGDGWLGKAIFAVIAFTVAWFSRRPAERASIMLAVDKRLDTAMQALERQLKASNKRCDDLSAQHEQCERDLDALRRELRAAIPALMSGQPAPDYTTITRQTP